MIFTARILAFLSLFSLSLFSHASIFGGFGSESDGPLQVGEAYQLEVIDQGEGRYQLFWEIEDGYYLYKDHTKFKLPPGVVIVDKKQGEAKLKEDPLFGEVEVYYNQAVIDIAFAKTVETLSNNNIEVEYQGCWEGGICYPPVHHTFSVTDLPDPNELPGLQETSKFESAGFDGGLSLTDQNQVTQVLQGASFPVILLLFFVAGLALSLTPCVFPMIPILASVIAGQKELTARGGFVLSITYVLAMAVTYTLAGVFAGLFGGNIQVAFQTPWVIVLFFLLFVAFSGAMFGFYRMEMPLSLQNKLNLMCRSQRGGDFFGVAIMGLLSALIVGPCVAAPLAGALIFIGQTGDPYLGGSALFSMSLGMGVPLILVGTSAAKFLPQAGTWMNTVKQSFGVIMLLMAVWMLDRIVPPEVTLALGGVILTVTAIFMSATDRLVRNASALKRVSKGVGIVLLVYGVALLVGALAGSNSILSPLKGLSASSSSLQADTLKSSFTVVTKLEELPRIFNTAKTNSQPVILDFYADWCVSCKELEHQVFGDSEVQRALANYQLVKVDLTSNDKYAKAFYQQYGVVGPPALVFYNREGEERTDKLLVGVPSVAQLLKHIEDL